MTTNQGDIRTGIVKAFDAPSYTATVQITGSIQLYLASVPVSRDIVAGDLVVGRKVAVAFFDPANHADAVLFAVWA